MYIFYINNNIDFYESFTEDTTEDIVEDPIKDKFTQYNPSMSSTSSIITPKIKIKFKINTTYPDKNNIDLITNQISYDLSKLLNVTSNRFQKIELYPIVNNSSDFYVTLYIYPDIPNTEYILNMFKDYLKNNQIDNNYIILQYIDINYDIIRINDLEMPATLSNIIPVELSIIDKIINNNLSFALSTNVTNYSIPDLKTITQKMYLNVPMTDNFKDTVNKMCTSADGILNFNSKLTIGSVFKLSKVSKYLPYKSTPYKYVDFNKIHYNNNSKESILESIFYNLSLKVNNYSLTYCQNNCDNSNVNGFCTSSIYNDNKLSENLDLYNTKNLIKIKIEPDNTITPYFISIDKSMSEKIYFITNNYSTYIEPYDFKTLVQVPIYSPSEQYYKTPNYIEGKPGSKGTYTYTNTPIRNLSLSYSKAELDNYSLLSSFPISSTLVDRNDAYNLYAYNFTIEIIDDETYNSL